ncbi:MAG: response regulator [Woeseiaceae bacterium]|nr:response regulator [Woeseiaceae bacterium]
MTAARVLFVDDEPSVLDGIRRQLRKLIKIDTAVSGEEGLTLVRETGPFEVVVSDMRMPNMNGAEFLAQVNELSPDTVRIILSGQADLESTIAAVNSGQLFRFLTKPCSTEDLWATVKAGIDQFRLINIERELLENTLSGAVSVLTEILGITNPAAFSRASRIRRYAESISTSIGVDGDWQFRLAAMLSQIGCITLPGDTLAKVFAGQDLSPEESSLYEGHPELAAKLLGQIPRLDGVAAMIESQSCPSEVSGLPADIRDWEPQVLGGEVLRLAAEFDRLICSGKAPKDAVAALSEGTSPQLAEALKSVEVAEGEASTKLVKVGELVIGMTLDEDLMSTNGMRLMPAGQEITESTIIRLRSVAAGIGIAEPFRVRTIR